MRSDRVSLSAGWVRSNGSGCLFGYTDRWRWGSPLTAFGLITPTDVPTFSVGGLPVELSLDCVGCSRGCERTVFSERSDRAAFLVRVSLRHAAYQPHGQSGARIFSHLFDRARAA